MLQLTAGGAQPAGWGDGFFGGDGGDDEGFAAATGSGGGQAAEQAPEAAGGSEGGANMFGQEGLSGLYGALGVASNRKPVVRPAPKQK